MYDDTDKPEISEGIKFWKNPKNGFHVLMLHYTADESKNPKTTEGAKWYEAEREGSPKAVWNKEYEIDFTTKAGQLVYGPEFCDFEPSIHLVDSFELGDVELFIGMDFGQRNPNCALVGAITRDKKVYIIDEYYNPAIPSVASKEMFDKFGYLISGYRDNLSIGQKKILADNTFQVKVIDPSTASKNRTKIIEGEEVPYSVIEDFDDNGWEFEPATNDFVAGVTRVREYMRIDGLLNSHLYIFKDKCPKLCWELQHYRYKENTEATDRQNNEPEKPVKKDDHCLAGDSIINTVNGDFKIKDLVGKSGYVYSYSNELKRVQVNRYDNVRQTKVAETLKITLDDDSEIVCTYDHPIMIRSGEYRLAGELKAGDSLMPVYQTIDSHGHTRINLNNGDSMFAHRVNKYRKKKYCEEGCRAIGFSRNKKEWNHKIKKIEKGEVIPVYNMHVDRVNNFSCNGIIVHNSMDALRYLIMTRPNKPEEAPTARTKVQRDLDQLIRPKILSGFDVD